MYNEYGIRKSLLCGDWLSVCKCKVQVQKLTAFSLRVVGHAVRLLTNAQVVGCAQWPGSARVGPNHALSGTIGDAIVALGSVKSNESRSR